ncbi:stalk domain-containing protein [Cohnella soli]|uniref:Stalk domain-containing protein n=1 Tax=Cohnella soli TaxID=425005 RepID=A0ABW0HW32_9BACL
MLLKKASIVSVIALAVGVSAVSAASAAPVATATKASAVKISKFGYIVNGVPVSLSVFFEKGRTLVSVKELSDKLGADIQSANGVVTVKLNDHVATFKAGSNELNVDGVAVKLDVVVKSVNGSTFIDMRDFVGALGGSFNKDVTGATWIDADLVSDVDHVQWANASKLIASQETETGRIDYLVDAVTGQYTKLLNAADASDLVVAPNGDKAAYTNAAGEVFVIDLASKNATKVSTDTSIKPELVWAADASAIYFLQGDKGSVIAKLDLADGKITKILEDKVDYKSNLDVSTDGKTFTYAVTKPGAVVADANKPVEDDDVAIDMKGTEPQLFQFVVDPAVKDAKAVQLTTSTDDKVFIHAAADGSSVTYVSASDDANVKSKLLQVGKDKTVKTLFDAKDVYQATLSNGKWYLLTEGDGSSQSVYEVNAATGSANVIGTVSEGVTEIVAKSGAPLAVINDGILSVNVNGLWKPTSR